MGQGIDRVGTQVHQGVKELTDQFHHRLRGSAASEISASGEAGRCAGPLRSIRQGRMCHVAGFTARPDRQAYVANSRRVADREHVGQILVGQ